MRLLLLSKAKREGMGYLEHARGYFQAFLGESVRELGAGDDVGFLLQPR